MHVTVISARGRMARCEINEMHDGAAELRITSGSNTVILQMDWHQLAAMAQELYEALETLVDELEWEIGEEKWGRDPDALAKAKRALAKARGEAS